VPEQKHMNWHIQALNEAFVSVDALHYKYTKGRGEKVVEPEVIRGLVLAKNDA
jgi:hypothetical protein